VNILFDSFIFENFLWNPLPVVFKSSASLRPLKYAWKVSTVVQTATAGMFMAAIPMVHCYTLDWVWDTVFWTWTRALNRLCSCGDKETDEHLLLNYTLHSAL